MKKLFLGFVLFTASSVNAQQFSENFDNSIFFTGWIEGNPSMIGKSGLFLSPPYAASMSSNGFNDSVFLISPRIDSLLPNQELRFWQRTDDLTNYGYHGIWISNTDTNLTNFVPILHNSINTTENTWEESIIDLSSYEGENIYLAFVYQNNNPLADEWLIDNISIQETMTTQLRPINLKNPNITIFPNPCNNQIMILSEQIILDVEIIDLQNRSVWKKYDLQDSFTPIISLDHLHSGFYLVKITTSSGCVIERIQKQ